MRRQRLQGGGGGQRRDRERNELSCVPPKVDEKRWPQYVFKPSLVKEDVHSKRKYENCPECCIRTYSFRFGMGAGVESERIKLKNIKELT